MTNPNCFDTEPNVEVLTERTEQRFLAEERARMASETVSAAQALRPATQPSQGRLISAERHSAQAERPRWYSGAGT